MGRLTYVYQCPKCGRAGPALPHAWVHAAGAEAIPEYDKDIAARHEVEQRAARAAGRQQYRDEYLQSERWKTKRKLVMQRDSNTCQACLQAPAEEVHHRTYARIGAEPAFDLVSLCGPCHRRLHAEAVAGGKLP
jgi:5-methylcytosine-specific restriction endonuclease McrA